MSSKISKKQSVLKELWKDSCLFKVVVIILGLALFVIADYVAALIEYYFWGIDKEFDLPSVLAVMCLNAILSLFICCVFEMLVTLICHIVKNFKFIPRNVYKAMRKMVAIRNSCYIPLTKEELEKCDIDSIEEYFEYISDHLYYGVLDTDRNSKSYDDYVNLNSDISRKVLLTCASVFDVNSVFSLMQKDYLAVTYAFANTCCPIFYTSKLIEFLSEYQNELNKSEVVPGMEIVKMSDDSIRLRFAYFVGHQLKKYIFV